MKYLVILLAGCLVGCASGGLKSDKLMLLKQGMTRQEVIAQLGSPKSIATQGNEEGLTYSIQYPDYNYPTDYWVVLVDGKVVRYGRPVEIDQNR